MTVVSSSVEYLRVLNTTIVSNVVCTRSCALEQRVESPTRANVLCIVVYSSRNRVNSTNNSSCALLCLLDQYTTLETLDLHWLWAEM